jgi:hypothetical protein
MPMSGAVSEEDDGLAVLDGDRVAGIKSGLWIIGLEQRPVVRREGQTRSIMPSAAGMDATPERRHDSFDLGSQRGQRVRRGMPGHPDVGWCLVHHGDQGCGRFTDPEQA